MADKWEYDIIPFAESGKPATLVKLNKLGGEGWELISIFQHPNPDTFDANSNIKHPFFAMIKKRL
jgi:Domain of unknown function (DUF4177)